MPLGARAALALGAGVTATFAYAPFGLWWLMPFALAICFSLWVNQTPKRAFLYGWVFGVGLMGTGILWVHHSMSAYGGMPLALAIFLALVLAAGMALYYGLAGWVTARFFRTAPLISQLVIAALAFTFGEWLRGWFLTGFPWLNAGYSQIDSPLAGYGAIGGVLFISLLTALSGAGIALLAKSSNQHKLIVPATLILIWGGGQLLSNIDWTEPDGEKVQVSMIQGNIPQDQKWRPENFVPTLKMYISHSNAHLDSDIIIWPESAIPSLLNEVQDEIVDPLGMRLNDEQTTLVTGILSNPEEDVYYNSILSADDELHIYHKRHLVPFGEYFPLGYLWKGYLQGLATMGDDFTEGDAKQPLLQVGDYLAGVSICYEIVFGDEIREALPQAHFLINMSNDAWFGKTNGPKQHLEIARMRAAETGRYLLRSTNTGITAVIAPDGSIEKQLPQFQEAVLTALIEPRQGMTPYARYGNLLFWMLWIGLFTLACWQRLFRPKQLLP